MKARYSTDDTRHWYNLLHGRWFYLSREGVRGPFLTEGLALQDIAHLRTRGQRRAEVYEH